MLLLHFLFVIVGVFGSDHCPGKLPSVLKDQTGFEYEGNPAAGNKFVLTFFENHPSFHPSYHHTIFVTTEEREEVSFTVKAPGIGFKNVEMATLGEVVSVQIPTLITNSSATHVSNRTVIVETEKGKTIIVYGINEEVYTADAFLALPTMSTELSNTSYKYIAASYTVPTDLEGFLAIIPQFPGRNTEVDVHFHLSGISGVPIYLTVANNTDSYFDNDNLHLTLNASQSVYLTGQGDTTGTVIVTNKPVSVFGGQMCSNVPFSIRYCDHLVEQFPPVSTWGTRFVTVPLKYRTSFDVFRFIAAYNCTDVSITCVSSIGLPASSWTFTLDEAQYHETNITSDEYCIVKSTNRLLVLQYSVGSDADGNRTGDPFMAVLPPADRFSNNLTFANYESSVQTYKHIVNIVIPATFFQPDSIYLGNSRLSNLTFDVVAIPDGDRIAYYGIRVDIEAGSHKLYHTNQHAGFGILVYGFTIAASYGYPGAYPMKGFDIDLYNLKVVNASDKCVSVLWDHPPDVTPGTLTYNMVLRDEKDFEYEWSTPNTQGTVCNLSPGTTYTFKLTSKSTDPSMHTTQAGTTTMKVVTSGTSESAVGTEMLFITANAVIVPVFLLLSIIGCLVVVCGTRRYYRKKYMASPKKFTPRDNNNDCAESRLPGQLAEHYDHIIIEHNPSYHRIDRSINKSAHYSEIV